MTSAYLSRSRNQVAFLGAIAVGASVLVILIMGWVGYLASDDRAYISMGVSWFQEFPAIPKGHRETRHTLTIPIGLSIAVFGDSELVTLIPNLAYSFVLLGLFAVALWRIFDPPTAILAVLVLVWSPFMVENMTVASVDIVEAFYILASFSLYHIAVFRQRNLPILFLSGVAAGLAFESRETSIALMLYFAGLFLFLPQMERWRYFLMGAGFWAVVGVEMVYYWIAAGNPFVRFEIMLAARDLLDASAPGTGNLISNRWIGPVAALLLNNEFGLLFWFAVGAGIWLARRPGGITTTQRAVLLHLFVLGLVWFVVIGYLLDLRALPRYFAVTWIAASVLVAVWIWHGEWRRWRWFAEGLVASYILVGLLLLDLTNQQSLLPERTAVALQQMDTSRPVHTDPRTASRAEKLSEWAGVPAGFLTAVSPAFGSLYVYSAGSVARGRVGPNKSFDSATFRPREDWLEIRRTRGEPTVVGRVLMALGLADFVVAHGLARMIWEADEVVVYRVPEPS